MACLFLGGFVTHTTTVRRSFAQEQNPRRKHLPTKGMLAHVWFLLSLFQTADFALKHMGRFHVQDRRAKREIDADCLHVTPQQLAQVRHQAKGHFQDLGRFKLRVFEALLVESKLQLYHPNSTGQSRRKKFPCPTKTTSVQMSSGTASGTGATCSLKRCSTVLGLSYRDRVKSS